jgi:hypothetical protein
MNWITSFGYNGKGDTAERAGMVTAVEVMVVHVQQQTDLMEQEKLGARTNLANEQCGCRDRRNTWEMEMDSGWKDLHRHVG